MTAWRKNYNPTGIAALSTILAALPVAALLVMIVFMRIRIRRAALVALALAAVIAVGALKMPAHMAAAGVVYGGAFGLFPVGWIILNAIFLYQLTVHGGHFDALRESLASIAQDGGSWRLIVPRPSGKTFQKIAGE